MNCKVAGDLEFDMRVIGRRLGLVLVGVGIAALVSKMMPNQESGSEGADQHHEQARWEQQRAVRTAAEVAEQRGETQGEKHWEAEQRYWTRSVWLSGGSLAGAVFSVALACLAFSQARRQADAGIATSRPWVTYEVESSGPLIWHEGRGHLSLDTSIRNLGRSPAQKVKAALFPLVGEAAVAGAEGTCERLNQEDFGEIGFVLFLDEGGKYGSVTSPFDAIFRVQPPVAVRSGTAVAPAQDLYIVACVLYDFGDGRSHETRRILRVMERAVSGNSAVHPMHDVAAADVVFRDRLNGERAD